MDLTNNYGYVNASYADIINKHWSVRGGLTYTENKDDINFNGQAFGDRTNGWHGKIAAALGWTCQTKFEHRIGDYEQSFL